MNQLRPYDAAIIVFDKTEQISFNRVKDLIAIVKKENPKALLVLVGTKVDADYQMIDYHTARELADLFDMFYIEVSAKTNKFVSELFLETIEMVLEEKFSKLASFANQSNTTTIKQSHLEASSHNDLTHCQQLISSIENSINTLDNKFYMLDFEWTLKHIKEDYDDLTKSIKKLSMVDSKLIDNQKVKVMGEKIEYFSDFPNINEEITNIVRDINEHKTDLNDIERYYQFIDNVIKKLNKNPTKHHIKNRVDSLKEFVDFPRDTHLIYDENFHDLNSLADKTELAKRANELNERYKAFSKDDKTGIFQERAVSKFDKFKAIQSWLAREGNQLVVAPSFLSGWFSTLTSPIYKGMFSQQGTPLSVEQKTKILENLRKGNTNYFRNMVENDRTKLYEVMNLGYASEHEKPWSLKKKSALHIAIQGGHLHLVNYLLEQAVQDEKGALQLIDILTQYNEEGRNILHEIVSYPDRTAILNSLLNGVIELNKKYPTKIDIRSYVLSPDHVEGRGNTPLHYAARRHCFDNFMALLDAGANLDAESYDKYKPLDLVAHGPLGSGIDFMEKLLKKEVGKKYFNNKYNCDVDKLSDSFRKELITLHLLIGANNSITSLDAYLRCVNKYLSSTSKEEKAILLICLMDINYTSIHQDNFIEPNLLKKPEDAKLLTMLNEIMQDSNSVREEQDDKDRNADISMKIIKEVDSLHPSHTSHTIEKPFSP